MTERLGPLSLCHTHSHLTSSLGALSSHSRPNPSSACPVAALTSHDGKMGVLLSWTPEGLQRGRPHPWPLGPG